MFGRNMNRWRESYEATVPRDVRTLAEGVGLPLPTHYEGRTLNGYVELSPDSHTAEDEVELLGSSTNPQASEDPAA